MRSLIDLADKATAEEDRVSAGAKKQKDVGGRVGNRVSMWMQNDDEGALFPVCGAWPVRALHLVPPSHVSRTSLPVPMAMLSRGKGAHHATRRSTRS